MYFYLDKTSLINNSITVILQTENKIPNYKEITNFGELIEYQGDSIPNEWEFDGEYFYDLRDKPSPYHRLNENKQWVVFDNENFKIYCNTRVDEIKAEVLEYGFDYKGHRQKCRDKDIIFMAITALIMFLVKTFLGKDMTKKWYFKDDYFEVFDIIGLTKLMFTGSTFIQAVYDAENCFKTLENTKLIDKMEFLAKVKELQNEMI